MWWVVAGGAVVAVVMRCEESGDQWETEGRE